MRALRRSVVVGLLLIGWACSPALAEDQPSPEQLQKMYDDALVQLKAAQDRKTELAKENEALTAKIAELNQQLEANQQRTSALEEQARTWAEQTFFLRSHYTTWQNFMKQYPNTLARWKVYLRSEILSTPSEAPPFLDSEWPMTTDR